MWCLMKHHLGGLHRLRNYQTKEIEDKLQQKLGEQIVEIRSSSEADEEEQIDEEHEEAPSPWKTGVYQRQLEEARPSEEKAVIP